jgi:hypothetical protein
MSLARGQNSYETEHELTTKRLRFRGSESRKYGVTSDAPQSMIAVALGHGGGTWWHIQQYRRRTNLGLGATIDRAKGSAISYALRQTPRCRDLLEFFLFLSTLVATKSS